MHEGRDGGGWMAALIFPVLPALLLVLPFIFAAGVVRVMDVVVGEVCDMILPILVYPFTLTTGVV